MSTYAQSAPGEHQGFEYSRSDNPTRTPLQKAIAELEHARHGLVFSSGLSAIDAVLNTLKSGDHVVAGDDLYGGAATERAERLLLHAMDLSLFHPLTAATMKFHSDAPF